MKMQLTLITINEYQGKDGENMSKFIFVSERGKVYQGYLPSSQVTPRHESMVTGGDSYDPARAYTWNVRTDSYNDKIVYKVDMDTASQSDT